MTSILVVDDEPQLVRALRVNLAARSYEVLTAGSGRQALETARQQQPDLVLLDLGLPDMDGVEVVRILRGRSSVPIIILSGRTQSHAKIRALEEGADDYVTKPFQIGELVARIRAVSRRAPTSDPAPTHVVALGDVRVDLQAYRATRVVHGLEDADIHLTRTEWRLLSILVHSPGRLVTQRELIRSIRGHDYEDAAHYIRQYMAQLRRKLEPDAGRPHHLLTEPGMGYRFQP